VIFQIFDLAGKPGESVRDDWAVSDFTRDFS
jgi:hypothetical protein